MSDGASSFFVTGGTMGQDTPSYVARQADTELYEGLRRGEFCYVLTARQMGKSSLMVRTANRLREDGATVVTLDLTVVGQNLTIEQWYYGLLNLMARQLGRRAELRRYWDDHADLGPLQRFMDALRDVVLGTNQPPAPDADSVTRADQYPTPEHLNTRTPEHLNTPVSAPQRLPSVPPNTQLVIFIDEIDSVLSLPFGTDELFAAIRQCYNRRAEEPLLERLTFCLLGVASPSDLIRDPHTTPFNIGRRVELRDFQPREATALEVGLQLGAAATPLRSPRTAQRLLRRILYWTDGHPYLTQRLCREVAETAGSHDGRAVDRICRGLFLTPGAQNRDDNLLFVHKRLVNREDDVTAYLDLYRRIRAGHQVRCDETDPRVPELRLSGIVRDEKGLLRVRNRIYYRVFGPRWIETQMPDAEVRRLRTAYVRGLRRSAAVAGGVATVMAGLAGWGVVSSYQARKSEAKLLRIADERGRALARATQLVYVSNIKSAWRAVQLGNYVQATELLDAFVPKRGEPDLRSWEWAYLWSICHPERLILRNHGQPLWALLFRQDGSELLSSDAGHLTLRHRLPEGEGQVAYSPTGAEDRRSNVISANGKTLFCLARRKSQTTSGSEAWELRAIDLASGGTRVLTRSPDDLTQLHTSANGDLVTTVTVSERPRRVRLWDGDGHLVGMLRDGDQSISAVAVAPGGASIATANRQGEVVLWDRRTLRAISRWGCSASPITHLAFSASGETLLAAGARMRTVSVRTGSLGPEVAWSGKRIFAVALSADGKQGAVAASDPARLDAPGEAEVWDLARGRMIRRLRGHTGPVTALAFRSDHLLATGGWDRTVRIWDPAASPKPEVRGGTGQPEFGVAFWPSPDSLAIRGAGNITLASASTASPTGSLPAPFAGPMEVS
ncbi:MAG: putative Chase2 sensor protein, partial [Armatimonadetes bacterium]|nr:putative Chase2 sensor protein [Armatimonadota bacterium]